MTSALFTDFYSLTMAQGYWKRNLKSRTDNLPISRAVFEMFFRHQPFNSGYSVFAGLGTLLERLVCLSFSDDDIAYLKSCEIFEDGFLEYL
ncbi:MAG: nicotinate phosphoribosyltransferase, partial [Treponema sp.]|nr:nicotinate phosphoribosyltransferase [Treponema sp.]